MLLRLEKKTYLLDRPCVFVLIVVQSIASCTMLANMSLLWRPCHHHTATVWAEKCRRCKLDLGQRSVVSTYRWVIQESYQAFPFFIYLVIFLTFSYRGCNLDCHIIRIQVIQEFLQWLLGVLCHNFDGNVDSGGSVLLQYRALFGHFLGIKKTWRNRCHGKTRIWMFVNYFFTPTRTLTSKDHLGLILSFTHFLCVCLTVYIFFASSMVLLIVCLGIMWYEYKKDKDKVNLRSGRWFLRLIWTSWRCPSGLKFTRSGKVRPFKFLICTTVPVQFMSNQARNVIHNRRIDHSNFYLLYTYIFCLDFTMANTTVTGRKIFSLKKKTTIWKKRQSKIQSKIRHC